MILRNIAFGNPNERSQSVVGINGNSPASMPLMFDSKRAHFELTLVVRPHHLQSNPLGRHRVDQLRQQTRQQDYYVTTAWSTHSS